MNKYKGYELTKTELEFIENYAKEHLATSGTDDESDFYNYVIQLVYEFQNS